MKAEINEPLKRREKKLEQKKVMKPEMPLQGPAKGGRTPQSGTLAQYVMKDLYKDVQRDMDPREALLAHAKIAENDPIWVAPAYQKT
jgi:WD repeat-containing protein 70